MGFFSAITGTDSRKKSYLDAMHRCMRRLNEKADEMNIDLSSYYNTSNTATFQEKTIMFFLANAAATAYSDKESMIYLRGMHFDTLSDVLLKFLTNNGFRGMDYKSHFYDIINPDLGGKGVTPDMKLMEQGLFGRDLIIAEKRGDINAVNDVLDKILFCLINEKIYSEVNYEMEKIREIRRREFAGIDPKFFK